jgi:hypothetical protein
VRVSLFARSAFPLIALVFGVAGWLPLFLSAGLAMGDAGDSKIAVALALAGAAALLGLMFGSLGLRDSRSAPTIQIGSALGLLLSVALALVVLVFALSFHW